jgi:hypothetical protein
MKKTILYSIVALSVFGLTGVSQASAFSGMEKGSYKGNKLGLVTPELRAEFKASHKNLTKEEKLKLKGEKQAYKQTRQEDMKNLLGLTKDEVKTMKKSGMKMSDIVAKQGVTEAQARTFFTDRITKHADQIIATHNVTAEQATTIKSKIGQIVDNIISHWFSK